MATLVEQHGGAVMRWWVTPMPCLPVVMLAVASWALWLLIVVVLQVEVMVVVVVSPAPTHRCQWYWSGWHWWKWWRMLCHKCRAHANVRIEVAPGGLHGAGGHAPWSAIVQHTVGRGARWGCAMPAQIHSAMDGIVRV